MRDYSTEAEKRVAFILKVLEESGASGILFGNSGGKDSALVGILCKIACKNTIGVIMPCSSELNYTQDMDDAYELANRFDIENIVVDLTASKKAILKAMEKSVSYIPEKCSANIAPRLRMTTLYTLAQSKGFLVAGTGNRSERYMGYFTKWGDGAYDFNPIADLTATEVYEFLRYFNAPESIISKVPSAGLYEGQTDEKEMGVTYAEIDEYILTGETNQEARDKIVLAHEITEHKRTLPPIFQDQDSN